MKKIFSSLIIVVVLFFAAGTVAVLYENKPQSKKKEVADKPVPIVETLPLKPEEVGVEVAAFGTVIPARRLELKPEVEGKIVSIHPDFTPGGVVAAGSTLFEIDPSDYRFQLEQRRADLAQARYQLELELGQQVIAKNEWRILEEEGAAPEGASRSLALRQPHLRYARARLRAAESALAAAELDLARTRVTAPFEALVLDKGVEEGQLVARAASAATLVATDRFWVQVAVGLENVGRIEVPATVSAQGSAATITLANGSGAVISRKGRVLRLLGDLDQKGRMARYLVAIDDPLGRLSGRGKILLESHVRVKIEAGSLTGVYRVPREALRENDTLWLMREDNTLAVQPVTVEWRREEEVLVSIKPPPPGRLITSRLQVPLPGMTVKDVSASPRQVP